jgi:hypothetical protein
VENNLQAKYLPVTMISGQQLSIFKESTYPWHSSPKKNEGSQQHHDDHASQHIRQIFTY